MNCVNTKVSIIIPTYNRSEQLCRCINSLLLSTYKNIEIIVVNNNSSDNTKQAVNDLITKHPNVILVNLEENLFATGGRNEGIKHASGDYLLFVDSDNVVDSFMIEKLVEEMNTNQNIGLIGPIMFYYKSVDTIYFCGNTINYLTSKTTYYLKNKNVKNVKVPKKTKTDHIPNVFMTRKSIINETGVFDDNIRIMYDESDFAMRIKKLGYDVVVLTSAITYHDVIVPGEKGVNKLRQLGIETPERAYHFAKNRNIFVKRYFPWYGKITYNLIFKRLFAAYYMFECVSNNRIDIAKAYFKGMKYEN